MFRQSIITLLGFGCQMMVTLAAGIMAARLLEPTGRGELAALMMVPLLLLQLANFGTPQALTYFTAKEPKNAGSYLGANLLIQFAGIAAALLVGWWLVVPLLGTDSAYLVGDARLVMVLLLLLVPFQGTTLSVFLGHKFYVDYNLQRMVPSFLYLLAVLSAFWYRDPLVIVLLYLAGIALIGLPSVFANYAWRIGQPVRFEWRTLRAFFPYAFTNFWSALPQLIGQRLDQFVTLAVLSLTDLGYYSIAVGLGQMYLTLQIGAGSVLLPHLADAKQALAVREAAFARMVRLAMLLATLLVGTGIALLPWVVPLMFGEAYTDAVRPAQLLLIAYGLMGVCSILADGFRGWGLPRLPLWMGLANLIVKALLFVLLLQQLSLALIAGITVFAAGVGLVFALAGYHFYVSRIDRAWLGQFDDDARYLVARLWQLGVSVLRMGRGR